MLLLDDTPALDVADPFDPRNWEPEPAPDAPMRLCLSARWDIHVWLDYQDWLWARHYLWCHDYGSGEMVEKFPDIWVIARPDHIYARRSVPIPGRKTPTGRPAYGSEFLHRRILKLKTGRDPKKMIGDHKDGDTLNCRRYNLRWATKSQNSVNVPGSRVRMRFQKLSYERAPA